jgi:RHS repeat-associated protein
MMGRTLSDKHADSSSLATYYGTSVTGAGGISPQLCTIGGNGYGYPILAIDEAGHKRQHWTDGFGNTVEVDEPDPVSGSLTKATCYSYDALGNLLGVTQGGQTRSFTYDGLSRVLTATTSESGTTSYSYTNGSAVCSPNPSLICSKTDALSITTTYTYDALGRMTGKSYSGGNPSPVTYTYDSGTGQKGYLTGMSDGSGSATWTHDADGRITAEQRIIAGVTESISYAWNEDGTPQQITYPSGRQVIYTTNNAERPTSAWDAATPTVLYEYESIYSVAGALRGTYNGHIASVWDGIHFTESFNNRLQVNGFSASSSAGNTESLAINYAVPNNGNISSITNGITSGLGENYTYDLLDRIFTGGTQSSTVTGCWGQGFGPTGGPPQDRFGNLTQISVTQCTAGMLSVTAGGGNQLVGTGYAVNSAGNMTQDGTGNVYTFDAENHIAEANGPTGGPWYYIYDGHGVRVAKCSNPSHANCTSSPTAGTLYWRDVSGNVLSESDLSGNFTNDYIYFAGRKAAQEDASGNVHYLYPDQANNTVAMADSSGNTCYTSTFTPYGEEHPTTSTCSTNYKFTGYERDSETQLDYAFARNYSFRLGRFMSADPLGGTLGDPQTHNRFAYVGNRPITLVDPTGEHYCAGDFLPCIDDGCEDGSCTEDGGTNDGGQGDQQPVNYNCDPTIDPTCGNPGDPCANPYAGGCSDPFGGTGPIGWGNGNVGGPDETGGETSNDPSDPCVTVNSDGSYTVNPNTNAQQCTANGGQWVPYGSQWYVDSFGQVHTYGFSNNTCFALNSGALVLAGASGVLFELSIPTAGATATASGVVGLIALGVGVVSAFGSCL